MRAAILLLASTMAAAQSYPTPVVSDPATLVPNSPSAVHQKEIDRIKTITRHAQEMKLKAMAMQAQADSEAAQAAKLISDTQTKLGFDRAFWEWSPTQEDFVHKAGVK